VNEDRGMKDLDRAAQHANTGLGRELLYFLRQSKKWWLLPMLVILVLFGALMLLSSTAAAPFIYTLF
jgi:Family of unknown function (DUF5989)